jgi:hypothetical protein
LFLVLKFLLRIFLVDRSGWQMIAHLVNHMVNKTKSLQADNSVKSMLWRKAAHRLTCKDNLPGKPSTEGRHGLFKLFHSQKSSS